MSIKVRNRGHLRELVAGGKHNFLLVLGGGGMFSRKTIRLTADGRYRVTHHVDGTKETLTVRQLYDRTNIGRAITVGCFYADDGRALP